MVPRSMSRGSRYSTTVSLVLVDIHFKGLYSTVEYVSVLCHCIWILSKGQVAVVINCLTSVCNVVFIKQIYDLPFALSRADAGYRELRVVSDERG